MPTQSRPAFDLNVRRARYFLQIHQERQVGAGAPPLAYRELPRAAVVFAVGAIDAYLSEMSAEVMVRQLQSNVATNVARETLKRVQQEIPTLALEIAALVTGPERVQRIREALVDHFHSRVTNYGPRGVAATMERIGHTADEVWSHLAAQGFHAPANRLDHWTEVRHNIVHRGQRPRVRRPQAEQFIEFAEALVARIDSIAENA